ncbi:hypothetical protein [Burkholderia ubonensis]|uniref:hypothetical protein n=1 Tax=Burkholderia ubonensis TaxID=101571 RepID=UPI0012FC1C86|nr:hypothetical protein [Burkholderia ubonensis]
MLEHRRDAAHDEVRLRICEVGQAIHGELPVADGEFVGGVVDFATERHRNQSDGGSAHSDVTAVALSAGGVSRRATPPA